MNFLCLLVILGGGQAIQKVLRELMNPILFARKLLPRIQKMRNAFEKDI